MSTYGIRNQLYKDAAEQAYSLDPQKDLGDGFLLDEALSTPTLKFYKQTGASPEQIQSTTEPGKVLVGIRGTQVTDWRDLSADSNIAIGKLDTSVRARQDFIDLERAKAALSMFPFYGAGHSLGGALLDLFIKRGYIIGGRSYNGALQLGQEEETNQRIYNTQDALYNLSQPFLKQTPETYSTDNYFNAAKKASGLGSKFKYTISGPTTYLIDTIRNQSPQILGAHGIKTVGAGLHGAGFYDDAKAFIGNVRRTGEKVYNTGKQAQETFIDTKEHLSKGNDVGKAITGHMAAGEDIAKDLLFGGGFFDDAKAFIGNVRRTGEKVYNTGKQAQETFIDTKEHLSKGNDMGKAISGHMAAGEDTAKDLLFGGAITDYIPSAIKNLIPTVDTNLANVTNSLFDYFGYGSFDAKSQQFLQQHGDENVISLVIRRAPVANMLHQAVNAITSGKWNESRYRYGYDKLFHLGLVINGKYIFEYLSHATIGPKSPDAPGSEFENVDGLGQGRTFTIKGMLETTLKKVGKDKFFKYDTFTNNCQDHVLDILIANDIGKAPGLQTFIKQPVEQLLKEMPDYTQTVANTVTNGLTLLGAGKKRSRVPENMSRGDYYQDGLNRRFRYT